MLFYLCQDQLTLLVNGGNETDEKQTPNTQSDDDSDDEMESDNLGITTDESNIENILNDITLSVMQLRSQSTY